MLTSSVHRSKLCREHQGQPFKNESAFHPAPPCKNTPPVNCFTTMHDHINTPLEHEWEAEGGAGGGNEDTAVIQFHFPEESTESPFQGFGVIKEARDTIVYTR